LELDSVSNTGRSGIALLRLRTASNSANLPPSLLLDRLFLLEACKIGKLGDLFVEALKIREPEAPRETIEKEQSRPLRAPLISRCKQMARFASTVAVERSS